MRLDRGTLQVETFSTAASAVADPIIWRGKGGPESYRYICDPTGNTDPACQMDPETRFHPCTYNVTCVNCA